YSSLDLHPSSSLQQGAFEPFVVPFTGYQTSESVVIGGWFLDFYGGGGPFGGTALLGIYVVRRLQETLDRLAAKLDAIYTASGEKKINVITHSMGWTSCQMFYEPTP
ncbi:hypothetical protein M8C21_022603, partial [Ambrosia artemisiifolia]